MDRLYDQGLAYKYISILLTAAYRILLMHAFYEKECKHGLVGGSGKVEVEKVHKHQ